MKKTLRKKLKVDEYFYVIETMASILYSKKSCRQQWIIMIC